MGNDTGKPLAGDETRRIGTKQITTELAEVFLGCREGTPEERRKLERLKRELGDAIYRELLYALLHTSVRDTREARGILAEIAAHKAHLDSAVGRDIGIAVAALDYGRNVRRLLSSPAIIEEQKIGALARTALAEPAKEFDTATLHADLRREVERTRRYGSHFSLVIIDLDDLRHINTEYGSRCGDLALRYLQEGVRSNIRASDTFYRCGGDEFAVLLPNADRDTAGKVAEKLLAIARSTRVSCAPGKEFGITVSIGLESFDDQTVQNVEGILATVDTLLARAKASGKDRIQLPAHEGAGRRGFERLYGQPEPVSPGRRFVIRGLPISSGVALGKAFIYEDILDEFEYYEVQEKEIEKELERMRNAIAHVRKDIEKMERQVRLNLGKEYADIFMVHRTILSDATLIKELEEKLKLEGKNAEHIIRNVFKHFENRFMTSGNRIMRERSLDIADLSRRLLRYLAGVNRNLFRRLPKNSIIVAKRLLPSESVHLRHGDIRGLVTEKGSRNSHAGILARGLGLPYVSETAQPVDAIPHGATLIVDADRGEIVVNPAEEDKEAFRSATEAHRHEDVEMMKRFKDIVLTKDAARVRVMANVGTAVSFREAIRFGCDGIGLYRIEQIYMQSRIFPTQEQLFRILNELFGEAQDKEITVRLLDIGGDKTLPYFTMKGDIYAVLGMRGVRVLLRYPRILETQLVVLLKLSSRYNIKILIPMVTLPNEIAAVRGHLEKCKRTLRRSRVAFNERIALGAMVEIPAAALRVREILRHADFVSIGTNDLTQFTVATARENTTLAYYYEAGTDIVLPLIEDIIRAAKEHRKECSLCGELAADLNYTGTLLAMGLENFSVSPSNILKVKRALAELLGAVQPAAAETK